MTKRSTSMDALHARLEALSAVRSFTYQRDPFSDDDRPALQEVQIEPSGRCVATNGHVLAIFDPATPPAEQDYPTYEKVIPTEPPVVKVLMSIEYLKQALAQMETFGNDTVIMELWSETRVVKFSSKDEEGALCFYIMPKAMPPTLELLPEPSGDKTMDDEDEVPF